MAKLTISRGLEKNKNKEGGKDNVRVQCPKRMYDCHGYTI